MKASPVARRLARESSIDLQSLTGTGPAGRIVKADVLTALESGTGVGRPPRSRGPEPEQAAATPAAAASGGGNKGEATVQAARTAPSRWSRGAWPRSRATVPDFEVSIDIDMEAARELRAQLKAAGRRGRQPVPSFNDMVVKASALALQGVPARQRLLQGRRLRAALAHQRRRRRGRRRRADRAHRVRRRPQGPAPDLDEGTELFEVLLDRSVAPALQLVEKLEMVVAEPEVKLYALAYHDSSSITTRDLNVPLWQTSEAHQERYQSFWEHHKRLRAYYQQLVTEAYEAGTLVAVQPEVGSLVVIGIVEAAPVIARYDE